MNLQIPQRQVFYSFHYDKDCWRTQIVRNIGAIEGNRQTSPNEWEVLKNTGTATVHKWIDDNLRYRTCTIVLIGEETYLRPFILYEIKKSWELKKGIFGIFIHGLKDRNERTSCKGINPFLYANIPGIMFPESEIDTYDAGYAWNGYSPYKYIESNIISWIENAIYKRNSWSPLHWS